MTTLAAIAAARGDSYPDGGSRPDTGERVSGTGVWFDGQINIGSRANPSYMRPDLIGPGKQIERTSEGEFVERATGRVISGLGRAFQRARRRRHRQRPRCAARGGPRGDARDARRSSPAHAPGMANARRDRARGLVGAELMLS